MNDFAVVNPATGETVKSYPTLSDKELDAAIARADHAHRDLSRSSTVEERAALILRVGELHVERREALADIIVREMGKAREQAEGRAALRALRQKVLADAEHVGGAFPEEARKIHYGEAEERAIYGEASGDDVKALLEEGVPVAALPPDPDAVN